MMTKILTIALPLTLLLSCSKDNKIFTIEDADRVGNSAIEGQVLTRKGAALSGVIVVAQPGGHTSVTSIDGKYTISGLPARRYALQFLKTDYKDTMVGATDSLVVGLRETKTQGEVQLRSRYGSIKGQVLDPTNVAQVGAGVIIEQQNASATATSNGGFVLSRVEAGTVRLFSVVPGTGYGVTDVPVQPDDEIENVQIVLNKRGGQVQGTVTDASGAAIAGATVSGFNGALTTQTDANGVYTVPELPKDGDLQLKATKGNMMAFMNGVNLTGLDFKELESVKLGTVSDLPLAVVPTTIFAGDSKDYSTLLMHYASNEETTPKPLWYFWSFDKGKSWYTSFSPAYTIMPAAVGLGKGTHEVRMWCMTQDSLKSDTVSSQLIIATGDAIIDTSSTPIDTATVDLAAVLALDSISVWHTGMNAGRNAFGFNNDLTFNLVNTQSIATGYSYTYDTLGTFGVSISGPALTEYSLQDFDIGIYGWDNACASPRYGGVYFATMLGEALEPKDISKPTPADTASGYLEWVHALDLSAFSNGGIRLRYTSEVNIAFKVQQASGTYDTYGNFTLAPSVDTVVYIPFRSMVRQNWDANATFALDLTKALNFVVQSEEAFVLGEKYCSGTTAIKPSTTLKVHDISLLRNMAWETSSSSTSMSSSSTASATSMTHTGPTGTLNGSIWKPTNGNNSALGGYWYVNVGTTPITPIDGMVGMNSQANGYLAHTVTQPTGLTGVLGFIALAYLAPASGTIPPPFDATAHAGLCFTYKTSNDNWRLSITQTDQTSNNNHYRYTMPNTSGIWTSIFIPYTLFAQGAASEGVLYTLDKAIQKDFQFMYVVPNSPGEFDLLQAGFDNECF